MSSTPEYILKKPVTVELYDDGDLYIVDGELIVSSEEAKALFVPLDRQALTEQLEEILHEFSMIPRGKTYTPSEWSERIFRLFGLENTGETK